MTYFTVRANVTIEAATEDEALRLTLDALMDYEWCSGGNFTIIDDVWSREKVAEHLAFKDLGRPVVLGQDTP